MSSSTFSLDELGRPRGHVEGYMTQRTYHPVYGVILTEIGGDGLYTEYRYIHGSNLLRQKLVGGHCRISREFFEYDKYANLTRHIVDNGTGDVNYLENVTVRKITDFDPITMPGHPSFGKSVRKTEKYWEAGAITFCAQHKPITTPMVTPF